MADASGLNQQQAIAASIPYKNIGLGNPAETFLSAYMMATQINAKRQQLEQEGQRLSLENKRINVERELGQGRLAYQMQSAERRAQIAEGVLAVHQAHETFSEDKTNEQVKQFVGLMSDLSGLKSKPGDPEYPSEVYDKFSKYPVVGLSSAGRAILKNQEQLHNKAVAGKASSITADWNLLDNQLKSEKIPVEAIENPDIWRPQYRIDGKDVNYETLTEEQKKKAEPTGKLFILTEPKASFDTSTGQRRYAPGFATKTLKEIQDYQKRLTDIRRRSNTLPPQITNSDTGTVPITTSAGTAPPPRPSTEADVNASNPNVIEKNGHHYEVNHATKQVIRQID